MQHTWQKIIKTTITITFFLYMLHTSYVFTPADIISIIGLFFAILSYIEAKNAARNAKSAEERAQEAVEITRDKANKYSDHLLLHSCQRLVGLIQKALNTENKQDSKELCDFIRLEIVDFRDGVTEISRKQKRIIQDLISCLSRYDGTVDKKEELTNSTSNFRDLISELAHNKGKSND